MTLPHWPTIETEVLERWKRDRTFAATLAKTEAGERFVFFEGPPTANGRPGIHHVIARAFKDVICRFKTMQGKYVERKAGWDTQGLPVELEVEKQIGVSGKRDIEKYGIEKFNQACRESVWKYTEEWKKLTERIGYWLDLEHPYVTYEKSYIESLWWIFKQLWDKKLLVKDYKVVPQCPRCETALSSHEVAQGYERVPENSVYVKFKVKSDKGKVKKGDYILSWTTTPWTLPGNVALAIKNDISYIRVEVYKKENGKYLLSGEGYNNQLVKEHLVLAKDRQSSLKHLPLRKEGKGLKVGDGAVTFWPQSGEKPQFNDTEYKIVDEINGYEIVGTEYSSLFPGAIPESTKGFENAFKVYAADFVTTEEGTGVVHTAVMYGEDDYQLGAKVGLPKHHTVTPDGHFKNDVKEFAGQFVKDDKTQKAIVQLLDGEGLIFKTEEIIHDYPKCWRCHSPLLYYAKDSWFIMMSRLRQDLINNNRGTENHKGINWIPAFIKEGRFGEWLNEVKDWAISRERYWGTPLPIWECDQCHERECIGGFEELAERSGQKKALDEKFDPHRPFIDGIAWPCSCGGEMKRIPEVADTWFDSGSMPFAQWHYMGEAGTPFDNNFPADYIAEAIDQTRGWFYTLLAISTALDYKEPPYKNVICLGHVLDARGQKMSKHIGNVVNPWDMIEKYGADAVRFYFFSVNQPGDVKLFDEKSVDGVVKKFFMILWNVVNFWELNRSKETKSAIGNLQRPLLDRWILSRLFALVNSTTAYLDNYDVTNASRIIVDFVNDLSTWYVRRSRDRFKQTGADRDAAEQTLTLCLETIARLLAPFTPLLADALWARLGHSDSVHLADWPKAEEIDASDGADKLIDKMKRTMQLVEFGHALRAEAGIRVRQPLEQFVVMGVELDDELKKLMRDELNVREVIVGKELPMGEGWRSRSAPNLGVALDCTITDELREAGWVREVIRYGNDERKRLGLQRSDRIRLSFDTDDELMKGFFQRYGAEVIAQINASEATASRLPADALALTLDGHQLRMAIEQVK